jgi:hypothetical protein
LRLPEAHRPEDLLEKTCAKLAAADERAASVPLIVSSQPAASALHNRFLHRRTLHHGNRHHAPASGPAMLNDYESFVNIAMPSPRSALRLRQGCRR